MHRIPQFDRACLGYVRRSTHVVPVYDFQQCLLLLQKQERMDYEEAYALMRALVEESTDLTAAPVFLFRRP